jgi:hypothetical protein
VCVFISYVDKHVRVDVCDLAPACVYGIAHCELRTCAVSSFSHPCAYSLWNNRISDEGAQHIAAALGHNSTLQNTRASAVHGVLA